MAVGELTPAPFYYAGMAAFREALRANRVLLMDGAMGTQLLRTGFSGSACLEACALTHPEIVRFIHHAFIQAGAQCLVTDTFQANPRALARHGLEDQLGEIGRAAVACAREAVAKADRGPFVLGSIGPGPTEEKDLKRVLQALAGVDALLLETWSTPEAVEVATHLQGLTDLPVLLSFAFRGHPGTSQAPSLFPFGLFPEQVAGLADQADVAALGVNCGRDVGMDEVIEIVRRYRLATDLPLFARPNAGAPTLQGGQWVYPYTPEDMAARLPELLEAGVGMVGGCCGTTPEHIAAFLRKGDLHLSRTRKR